VSVRAALDASLEARSRLLLFGDAGLLRGSAERQGLPFDFDVIPLASLARGYSLPHRGVVDIPVQGERIIPGRGSPAGGAAAARNVIECVSACMRGRLAAMVTAPLNKAFLHQAGYLFPGHTEFLAHLSGAREVAMAFLTERLKIVLVTVHVPLRVALEQITPEIVLAKLRITLREFPRLGLPCSRVGVAAVNPHAGESGLLGDEEVERIEPALVSARQEFPEVLIDGPLPADTLFYRAAKGAYDVVLALFHDQGLAPLKMMGFGAAVNLTLGLPFIRTSVDHGTAFDIAGKGTARPDSMIAAVGWAVGLSARIAPRPERSGS